MTLPPSPRFFARRPRVALAGLLLAGGLLGGCATSYPAPPPPPPRWAGESWHAHVARCAHRFPHYDPRTDLVYRRGGTFACPL